MTAEDGLIYVAGRHITWEKEAAAALEQAQRQSAHLQKMEALGQLTGGIAHDFNNLLMVVGGYAQTVLRRITDPKDVRALKAIQTASSRGESLTRQLLSFSRSQPLNPATFTLVRAIDGIRDVLSGSLNVNIEMFFTIPETVWPIHVDRAELELALVNLVVNARDAMPKGGRLVIAAENVKLNPIDTREGLNGEFVALSVTDTGSGIPRDILDRIFEPFFTTKGAEKGTGLGLSQIYGFSRRSGGAVVVDSVVNRGTKVTIYLPRSRAPGLDAEVTETISQYVSKGNELVLVVEDNHDVRAVTMSLLEQLGYRSIAVESASEALKVLESNRSVNLVFTDVLLPGEIDGLTLARRVKDRYPEIAIILATGYAKVFDTVPEFRALRKPYEIADMARAFYEALKSVKLGSPTKV
jgi:nitrogen-specific signal transduction histidine kinase/ActR/RegA family two-component response regulator